MQLLSSRLIHMERDISVSFVIWVYHFVRMLEAVYKCAVPGKYHLKIMDTFVDTVKRLNCYSELELKANTR